MIASLLDEEYYRLSLWNCVFFIFGILFYFALKYEPSFKYLFSIFAVSLFTLYFRKYGSLLVFISNILIAFISGMIASKIRADNLDSVALSEPITTTIRGSVSSIKHTIKGAQIVLDDVLFFSLLMQEKDPKRIRVAVKALDAQNIMIGDYVELSASLMPPPRSILPGGYDFGLYAYFGEIGAVGYSLSKLKVLESNHTAFKSFVQGIRKNLYYKLINSMGKDRGNFAAALLIGEQGGLDKTIIQNMRFSGVSHVLCVSGMHLSLVAGIFFLSSRILLNLSDKIAWNFNVKNIAAVIAIIGAGFYLLLSGTQIAATRAFIMTSIVMFAVICNRMAFSRRSLSIAAIIILTLNPEYVLHPSFQMSFVAVLALIGGFEFYMSKRKLLGNTKGIIGKFKMGFCSNIYSTIVASSATTPLVLYHFYIMSNYTIFANMFVVPLITLIIMPLGVLAVILMPLNLDYYILFLMGKFIDMIIYISDLVANIKGAVWYFGYISSTSLIIYMFGLFWLMLWNSRIRLFGIPIIAVSFIMMSYSPKPDVIFDANAGFLAVKNTEGKLEITGNHLSKFHQIYLNNWFGQNESIYIKSNISHYNHLISTFIGKKIAVLFKEENCDADIVLNMIPDSKICEGQLDENLLSSIGAVLIFCDDINCRAEYDRSKRFKF
jgi:competence protein ComEC